MNLIIFCFNFLIILSAATLCCAMPYVFLCRFAQNYKNIGFENYQNPKVRMNLIIFCFNFLIILSVATLCCAMPYVFLCRFAQNYKKIGFENYQNLQGVYFL